MRCAHPDSGSPTSGLSPWLDSERSSHLPSLALLGSLSSRTLELTFSYLTDSEFWQHMTAVSHPESCLSLSDLCKAARDRWPAPFLFHNLPNKKTPQHACGDCSSEQPVGDCNANARSFTHSF
jgi:hypothetical protein